MVLINTTRKVFFSIPENEDIKKEETSDSIIHIPLGLGITGVAVKDNKSIYSNKVEDIDIFYPDVDNIAGINKIKHFLVVPFGSQFHDGAIGVVQLINKKDRNGVTNGDVLKLEAMRTMLGGFVDNISIIAAMLRTSVLSNTKL